MTAVLRDVKGLVPQPLRDAWNHPRFGPAVKLVALYLLLVEGAVQLAFGKLAFLDLGFGKRHIPVEIIVLGIVFGSLYALIAMGLILVYRANRIINFAQAQLGSVPAVIALLLIAKRGLPYLLAIPIALIGGALLGGASEVLLVRRFSKSPRLILTVVTIGIGYLLLVLEFFSKQWVGGELIDTLSLQFPTPFRRFTFDIGVVTFRGDHIMAVVVTGVLVIALGAFFKFTDMGIAVRASAENGERASLLGIPVKRVSTVVWVIAATLSAVGVFLQVPLTGLPLSGFVSLNILLYGLAVAVMGRMDSLPTAFFAGIFVGITQQSALFSTGRASIGDATMLVVIVVALLVQRGKLSRAFELGASTWQAVKEVRPIPGVLRATPEVRRGLTGLSVGVGALVLLTPTILGDAYTPQASIIVIYAIIAVSLVVLTGWAGQISLGQYAISGISAAAAGGLAANHGWDFFAALVAAAVVGAGVAVVVGLPALRIQGLFLAVTTLAFAFAVESLLTRDYLGWLLPESGHLVNRPVLWGKLDLTSRTEWGPITLTPDGKFFYLTLVFLALAMAMARSFRTNRSGRVLLSVRDNGRTAQAFGISPARTRLAAFAVSGALAGLAGGLLAYQNGAIASNAFPPDKSIQLFTITVFGGIGSLPGAILGAVVIKGLPLLPGLRDVDQIEILTSALGLLLVLNFLPGGLAEGMYNLRDKWLRKVAAKHDLYVPSLVADSLVTGDDAIEVPPALDDTNDDVPIEAGVHLPGSALA